MTIDPYETVITYLLAQASLTALVSDRISVKHQYGNNWASNEVGLVVTPNGGVPDIYVEVQRPAIQFRIYAPSVQQGMAVWKVLNDISRATQREVVTTTNGDGLIYWLLPTSAPAMITDNELELDIILINYDLQVGEMIVP